jgi:hypothetical protein
MRTTYTEVAFDETDEWNKDIMGTTYFELKIKMVDQASAKAAVDVIL